MNASFNRNHPANHSAERSKHILIVHPDTEHRRQCAEKLIAHGYNVCTATTCEEAAAICSGSRFDLVLLPCERDVQQEIRFCDQLHGFHPEQQVAFLIGPTVRLCPVYVGESLVRAAEEAGDFIARVDHILGDKRAQRRSA